MAGFESGGFWRDGDGAEGVGCVGGLDKRQSVLFRCPEIRGSKKSVAGVSGRGT